MVVLIVFFCSKVISGREHLSVYSCARDIFSEISSLPVVTLCEI